MTEFRSKLTKIIAVIFIIIVILNITLVAAGKLSWQLFWIIIIFAAFVTYMVIPWIKGES